LDTNGIFWVWAQGRKWEGFLSMTKIPTMTKRLKFLDKDK